MNNSRKGLKRHGMRHYIVVGPSRSVLIERCGPKKYRTRLADMPPAFFYQEYRRLGKARDDAEVLASLDNFPDPAMPVCLRRFKP